MKELLEAGVHFGHQVRRWNPKMKEYIFGERNGIYIIDLQKTQKLFRDALAFVRDYMAENPSAKILFVGTKRQAQEAILEEAQRCEQYYIHNRWLGGLMTNYKTVQKSIKRLKDIEEMAEDGRAEKLTKKERLNLDREHNKLMKNLAGIKDMGGLPDMLFIIDVRKEEIAVKEANRLNIPVVAVVDTNCSPEGIDHVIPGNDDALRAIRLFASRIADAIIEGRNTGTEGMTSEDAELVAAEEGATEAKAAEKEVTDKAETDSGKAEENKSSTPEEKKEAEAAKPEAEAVEPEAEKKEEAPAETEEAKKEEPAAEAEESKEDSEKKAEEASEDKTEESDDKSEASAT